jgi:hypothetical protein
MDRQPQLRLFFLVILLCIICLAPMTSLRAQDYVTGSFEGEIKDSVTKAPIVGATVRITNQETGVPVAKQTDSAGRFRKDLLPPGDYVISISKQGYVTQTVQRPLPVLRPTQVLPPVGLVPEKLTETPTPLPAGPTPVTPVQPEPKRPSATAAAQPPKPANAAAEEPGIREEINTIDAQRGGTFTKREVSTLPLGAATLTRTFDEYGLLLPGVAPPPQTQGSVAGPGIGAGVGSSGQFAVNGLRSRANNFTMDGSDNNDEDIGVRRQGFLALVPQSVESIQEYQVITLLAPARYGRNFGAQVNAISKSGSSSTHGTFFGLLNTSQLNARNFFDTTNGNAVTPLQANGQDVLLENQLLVNGVATIIGMPQPLTVRNGSGGKESSTLAQAGFVLGGPLVPPDPATERSGSLFYFFSVEGQWLNATKETSFVVPTIAQRGFFNSGVTGVFRDPFLGTSVNRQSQTRAGAAVFSLFPFPNNPTGIYGANTLTRTLPASGFSKILSGKTNGNFYVRGKRQDITARYNFTDDARTVPVTGGALFSSLRPRVRTQNFSSFLTSEVTDNISNEVRASYGRTRLVFDDVPDREFLVPSEILPNEPFLLNAPYIGNKTRPLGTGMPNTGPVKFFRRPNDPVRTTSEETTGPIGQVKVAGFSTLGVDVFNFPQRRVNNTYQLADTLSVAHGNHRFAFGQDIRRVELNSDLPRNSRTLLEYAGQFGSDQTVSPPGQPPVLITPQDLVASGSPTGARQTINTTPGDSAIHLRYYAYDFFGQDEWRLRPNLSLSFGLRYEYDSPPRELDSRIESVLTGGTATSLIPALKTYFDGRTKIYDPERTNFAPRLGVAYARRLFGSDRETVFRAGYGLYYDQVIGAVVSQSRNVFPNFLTLNTGGGNGGQLDGPSPLSFLPPSLIAYCREFNEMGTCIRSDRVVLPGTLNRLNPNVSLTELLTRITNRFGDGGFGLTLPTRRLKTPLAQHYSFIIEQPLGTSLAVSLAYVGTQGRHLLRLNTPNAGENLGIVLSGFEDVPDDPNNPNAVLPELVGDVFSPRAPSSGSTKRPSGPGSTLGAVNLIETSANSRYDALQVQVRGRFAQRLQFQAAYTLGKATDDVSDVFDMAGASALPQDFTDLAAERGPANFDVRHRISHNLIFTLPQFGNSSHAFRSIFAGLEIASTGQFQTGQPFTVNSIFDVNGDGNFTDRLNSTNGLVITGNGQQPLQLTGPAAANPSVLLAPNFTDGRVGRNTFRADKLWLNNLAVVKTIPISEQARIVLRTELFNIFNRANCGIPVRFLEAPGFGKATDTVTPGRRIQFGLKLVF